MKECSLFAKLSQAHTLPAAFENNKLPHQTPAYLYSYMEGPCATLSKITLLRGQYVLKDYQHVRGKVWHFSQLSQFKHDRIFLNEKSWDLFYYHRESSM